MSDLFIVRVALGVGLALPAGLAVLALAGLAHAARPSARRAARRPGPAGGGPGTGESHTP
ncbi:hypothetical protein J7I94_29975 [Streptomyces sp. ISL-12]|uniref:hypothetical protein n=1 Tax=Streptomyces sp. ISL-12 TaxID=2819177 RepID=UPI001BE7E7B7|nr:hypothetical protein [Streptomyces sp. ISL-12]MBT2414728.1 hypothetical protein [Streptomyces sp. ISL-12]